jgi:hypothetical protein
MEKVTKKFLWADGTQAQERIQGTYLLFDKQLAYVQEIRSSTATIVYTATGKSENVRLNDDRWNDFRDIPPLGWINIFLGGRPKAIFLKRIPVRGRRHGLTRECVVSLILLEEGVSNNGAPSFELVVTDEGYGCSIRGEYPSLEEILTRLPTGCSAAFSPKFAVFRSKTGLFWIYRNELNIGFIQNGTIQTFSEMKFAEEELFEVTQARGENVL